MRSFLSAPWLIALLLVAGCATTPPGEQPESLAAIDQRLEIGALQGAGPESEEARAIADINRRLTAGPTNASSGRGLYEYRLGPDDVLSIEASRVEELHRLRVRIGGNGTVTLPLLGRVELAGLTLNEAEAELNDRLRRYMHQPQLSLFIDDYRSQEVTITGAVSQPGIYPVQRPRSLVELLSLAGGLTSDAGYTISARVHLPDPDNGRLVPQSLIVDLRELIRDEQAHELVLSGGDSIFVPEAGVFFVEGAVSKPGAYPVRGDMNLLKAIAMAGGTNWEAIDDDIRVIRRNSGQEPEVMSLDLAAIRGNEAEDIPIRDGDIVVVGTSGFKRGFSAFWRGLSGIFGFGLRI